MEKLVITGLKSKEAGQVDLPSKYGKLDVEIGVKPIQTKQNKKLVRHGLSVLPQPFFILAYNKTFFLNVYKPP